MNPLVKFQFAPSNLRCPLHLLVVAFATANFVRVVTSPILLNGTTHPRYNSILWSLHHVHLYRLEFLVEQSEGRTPSPQRLLFYRRQNLPRSIYEPLEPKFTLTDRPMAVVPRSQSSSKGTLTDGVRAKLPTLNV